LDAAGNDDFRRRFGVEPPTAPAAAEDAAPSNGDLESI
jgi:hypothetical protein